MLILLPAMSIWCRTSSRPCNLFLDRNKHAHCFNAVSSMLCRASSPSCRAQQSSLQRPKSFTMPRSLVLPARATAAALRAAGCGRCGRYIDRASLGTHFFRLIRTPVPSEQLFCRGENTTSAVLGLSCPLSKLQKKRRHGTLAGYGSLCHTHA